MLDFKTCLGTSCGRLLTVWEPAVVATVGPRVAEFCQPMPEQPSPIACIHFGAHLDCLLSDVISIFRCVPICNLSYGAAGKNKSDMQIARESCIGSQAVTAVELLVELVVCMYLLALCILNI